ncbi:hypothetical protein AB0L97_24980 [Nocardia sp. NPDC051911]|uniref:hypothetical protein n=1 Tax=Nocardia sp. NPDC051911 TaxID=3154648 RepID=UPI0034311E57
MLPAPVLTAPATAERGTVITVHGERWPCDLVRVLPDWSAAVTAQVQGGSFDARVDVPQGAALGLHSIPAACAGTSQRIVAKTSVEISPARLVPTPNGAGIPEPPGEPPPPLGQADAGNPDTGPIGIVGIGGFLLALGAAALVIRGRGKRPGGASHDEDPHLPRVHVRVVADGPPSIHVRQVARAPEVRVRLRAREPWLNVKEVFG